MVIYMLVEKNSGNIISSKQISTEIIPRKEKKKDIKPVGFAIGKYKIIFNKFSDGKMIVADLKTWKCN